MATSKKPDRLSDLTASLAARTLGGRATPPVELGASQAAATSPAIKPVDALVPNQSVSLYESDLDLLEQVRGWLSRRGVRGCNASEAIRVCLRLAAKEENGDALAEVCRTARTKDGRKTRWKRD